MNRKERKAPVVPLLSQQRRLTSGFSPGTGERFSCVGCKIRRKRKASGGARNSEERRHDEQHESSLHSLTTASASRAPSYV